MEDDDDYGKVDFEDDAGGTVAVLYIEKGDDGVYVLKGDAWVSLKLDVQSNDPSDEELTVTTVGVPDMADLKERVQAALNSGSGDTEWATLVDIGGILGLEYNDEEDRYE
jgi:hypothetical protein